jgi:hypothetical protein
MDDQEDIVLELQAIACRLEEIAAALSGQREDYGDPPDDEIIDIRGRR